MTTKSEPLRKGFIVAWAYPCGMGSLWNPNEGLIVHTSLDYFDLTLCGAVR